MPQFKKIEDNDALSYKLDCEGELPLKPAAFNVLGALKDFDLVYYLFEVAGPNREKIYYFELPGINQKPLLKFGMTEQIKDNGETSI